MEEDFLNQFENTAFKEEILYEIVKSRSQFSLLKPVDKPLETVNQLFNLFSWRISTRGSKFWCNLFSKSSCTPYEFSNLPEFIAAFGEGNHKTIDEILITL